VQFVPNSCNLFCSYLSTPFITFGNMTDVHDKATRSYNMSQIKGKNTKPEMLVRKVLFANGFRYRLHDKKLPGKPDIVLPKYKTVIFVNGCFCTELKDVNISYYLRCCFWKSIAMECSEVYLFNDQPITCPKCGNRTDIILDLFKTAKNTQFHKCLTLNCRNMYVVEEDVEDKE